MAEKIAVITGGAGGMGLATALRMGKDGYQVVVSDLDQQKLDAAADTLAQQNINCYSMRCDVADADSVAALAHFAADLGTVQSVVHTAGISPQMAGPEKILKVNALGTIHIAEAFHTIAGEQFSLVNVASMAGHMLPGWLIPSRAFDLALTDPDRFLKKLLSRIRFAPSDFYRRGMAYALSKNFVIWYSRASAARFGEKGARILSVSPGTFDTEMGRLEQKSGSYEMLKDAALKRPGRAGEIAELLAFCASERAGYMTGIDILCDGGTMAARRSRRG